MAAMIFFPAIDLKAGQCVRLVHGDMNKATVFSDDPAAQAQTFADAGCTWLHMVDLDGAFAGKPANADAVTSVLQNVDIKVQLGGGIRDMRTIEGWLERGLERVILGTVAVRDPDLVRNACKAFPGRVALGIDARDGFVAVEGWAEATTLKTAELAKQFEDAGAAALIYTYIGRDGAMQGP
jgi:phosphoribosylformimino-5-aminoimidazole carboxamide ribotide isomerase